MSIPRSEHPRPQLLRETWQNLNGEWDFLFDFGNSGAERELFKTKNFFLGDVKKSLCLFVRKADCRESDTPISCLPCGITER